MAVRDILRMGHPTLRKKSEPVGIHDVSSSKIQNLITDLSDTLDASGGIGLAAPQIGELVRVVIIKIPKGSSSYGELEALPLTVFINPIITPVGQEQKSHWEGCLSVPGLRGLVSRPQNIQLRYYDPEKKETSLKVEGFLSTVLQHECDHLDGTLYLDRLSNTKDLSFEEEFLEYNLN